MTATGCTFSLGAARYGGVLAIHQGSTVEFSGCTMTANAATGAGGALHCESGTHATLDHCIIAFGTDGEAIASDDPGGNATLSCCDLYNNAGGDWGPGIDDQLGVDVNVSEDPLFCSTVPDTDVYWALQSNSPFAQAPCGLMGAWLAACGTNAVLPASWGRIKAVLREWTPEAVGAGRR